MKNMTIQLISNHAWRYYTQDVKRNPDIQHQYQRKYCEI